ncbi:MAG: HAD family phosphatase [Steroidobacteraceae bacterium]|jgi:putative hydrolase of the HAD superfamily
MQSTATPEIRVVLFDVGGVLVELSGIETMLDWLGGNTSVDELWRMWLQSTPVRQFETGKIDAGRFATGVISEFGLPVNAQQFLSAFAAWPTGLFPGTLEMLARIPRSYRRAILSNSNDLHWPRVAGEMGLGAAFDHHFVSHLTGRIKPDADAFEHVVDTLACKPGDVLFLDDNSMNVDAARRFGMQAIRVRGAAEAYRAIENLGIIDGGA